MRWLHVILTHSIFISLCATALCAQTALLLHMSPPLAIYAFVFFSTICGYNFYWLLSKYSLGNNASAAAFAGKNASYLMLFFLSGLAVLCCLYFLSGMVWYVLVSVLLTLLYSLHLGPFPWLAPMDKWPRLGMMKTVLLAFTWAYVTVVLPAYPMLFVQTKSVLLLLLVRFLYVGMLCIIFDKRDVLIDRMYGLRSLATELSLSALKKIMGVSFVTYLLAVLWFYQHGLELGQAIGLWVSGFLVGWVYMLSLTRQRSYMFYYFLVDGLMLFTAGASALFFLL